MNRRTILAPLFGAALVLCGCKRSCEVMPESKLLTVVPGTGIVGVVEIGMLPADMPENIRERVCATLFSERKRLLFFEVDEWGVEFVLGEREPLGLITFHTVPREPPPCLPEGKSYCCREPFKGAILDGVSFANGPVHSDLIFQRFGNVEQVAMNSYGYVTNPSIPFILRRPSDEVVVNYPSRGLEFWMKSNTVESFRIFRPRAGSSQSNDAKKILGSGPNGANLSPEPRP